MKEQILKWIKRYGVTVWLIAVIILLAVSVSYAAYVNLDIEKYVLTTGKGNQAFFSSNHLYLTDHTETEYTSRLIPPVRKYTETNTYSFSVDICNHVYGNPAMVNLDDIRYQLQVTLLANGGTLPGPSDLAAITIDGSPFTVDEMILEPRMLEGGKAQKHTYTFMVPDSLKERIIFQIVALPEDNYLPATNNQKLAAKVSIADRIVIHNWSGRFLDVQDIDTTQYSGFNYEISGSGEGTVTLTWDADFLELSPWFEKFVREKADSTVENGVCTFPVSGENTYQLQFYISNKNELPDWNGLKSAVKVSFTPGS